MSSPPHLHLRNQLCLSLYSASNAFIRAYRPLLHSLDLTYPQYLVMLALWERDQLAVKDICEQTRLETGTVTPLLKRMEQKGLVTRSVSEEDERQKVIALTPKGHSLQQEAAQIPYRLGCMMGVDAPTVVALRKDIEQLYARLMQAIESGRKSCGEGELEHANEKQP